MAANVNKRFVTILSVVLVALVALLAVPAYFVLTKSAAENVREGDRLMQAGDFKGAEKAYGKAVSEERTNVEYLRKWRSAIESYTPEDRADFNKSFGKLYSAVYEIAYNQRTDLDAWIEYFEFAMLIDPARIEERVRGAIQAMASSNPTGADRVRRYRALIKVPQVTRGLVPVDDEEIALIEEDLNAALAAKDDDDEVARAMFDLHRALAARAQRQDPRRASERAQRCRQVVEDFLARHPDNARMRMTAMELAANGPLQALLGTPLPPDARPITPEMVDAVARLLEAMPAEEVTLDEIGQLQVLETMSQGVSRLDRTRALTERLMRARPDDVLTRWARAYVLRLSGDPQEAYDALQTVVELPMQRVSLDGYRLFGVQIQALSTQSDLAFRAWETGSEESAKEEAIERLRSRHAELSLRLPSDSPILLLSGARIAFATGDDAEARRLLAEHEREAGNDDSNALWMQARLAVAAGNNTEAATRLDRLLEISPGEMRALQLRAAVHADLREYDDAIRILERIRRALPDSTVLNDQIARLRVLAGHESADDPVQAAVLAAIRRAEGSALEPGDLEGAVAGLSAAIDRLGPDPRLYGQAATLLLNANEFDRARTLIREGLGANPDDPSLRRLDAATASGQTPMDVAFGLIDSSADASEFDKLLSKHRVALRYGEDAIAREMLDRASAMQPEHPAVMEFRILRGLADRDAAAVEALLPRAAELDLDGVGGRTYRAQLLLLNDDMGGALTLLEEASKLRPERVDLLQRIGRLRIAMGQTTSGLAAYEEAMRLRGGDPTLIADYATQLRAVGRGEDALRVLMNAEELARGNETLREIRLDLEAQVGNRSEALRIRREIAQREPTNRANRIKLASMLIDDAAWAESKPLIDALRNEGDSLELARMAARWHAEQGDLESGRRAFTEFIGALFERDGDLKDPQPYLELGSFLIRFGDRAGGLEAIRQARRWEDEETLRVEKVLGDTLQSLGMMGDAIESYSKIVQAGRDTGNRDYAKRLSEALMRTGRHDEADEVLRSLDDIAARDEVVLLLRSENAMLRGDSGAAREAALMAVRQFPTSSRTYVQRARLAMMLFEETGNTQLLEDARDDLTTAIRNDPAAVDAYRLRSQINARLGNVAASLDDLRDAALARPASNQLASEVIARLASAGRAGDAGQVAQRVIASRPNDAQTLRAVGGAFAQARDWVRARQYLGQAWARSRDAQTAIAYTRSLTEGDNPQYQAVLDTLGQLGDQVLAGPGLLLARGEALHRLGRTSLAIEDAVRSFALVVRDPAGPGAWFAEVRRIFSDDGTLLTTLQEAKRGGQRRELLDLFAARVLSAKDGTFLQGMELFDQLIAQSVDLGVQRSAYVFKGVAYMARERYEDAVLAWQEGLAKFGDEWQMHNNLAFVLTEELGRAREALPHAERALELQPRNPSVMDTVGWTRHRLGNDEGAEQALEAAVQASGSIEANPTISLHLAIVRASLGKKDRAQAIVRVIEATSRDGANLDGRDRELLEEARAKIASLP